MITDYRKRIQKYSLDGTPIFTTDQDSEREKLVAGILQDKWQCELLHLGLYSLVDYWAVRKGQPVGWVELKCRDYGKEEAYPTMLLNVRKWTVLAQLNYFSPWPALFVSAAFRADNLVIRYISIADINSSPRNWKVIAPKGGNVKSRNDTEPCILIPIEDMKVVYDGEAKAQLPSTNGNGALKP